VHEFISPAYIATLLLKQGVVAANEKIKKYGLIDKSIDVKLSCEVLGESQYSELLRRQNDSMVSSMSPALSGVSQAQDSLQKPFGSLNSSGLGS
jgi:hypothetical protein